MTCKFLLSFLSYALPCTGFVLFFIKQSVSIRKWEQRRENGIIGLTVGELDDFGSLMQNEVKRARCETVIEGVLVILGAVCGIITLFL